MPTLGLRRTCAFAAARTFLVASAVAGWCALGVCVASGVLPSWIDLDGVLPGPNGRAPEPASDAQTTLRSAPLPAPRRAPDAPASADRQGRARARAGLDAEPAGQGFIVGTFAPVPTPAVPQVRRSESRAGNGAPVEGAPEREQSRSAATQPPAARPDATQWDALYARGHQYQLQGNLVAAADAYRQAIQLNPEHAAALYDLGYVLQLEGEGEAAIDCYRRAIAHQPKNAFAHYNLGTLLQAKGDARRHRTI